MRSNTRVRYSGGTFVVWPGAFLRDWWVHHAADSGDSWHWQPTPRVTSFQILKIEIFTEISFKFLEYNSYVNLRNMYFLILVCMTRSFLKHPKGVELLNDCTWLFVHFNMVLENVLNFDITARVSFSVFYQVWSIHFYRCSKFAYEDIREVHKRRYLLQPIAVEVFSADGRNYLLSFPRKLRNKVFAKWE